MGPRGSLALVLHAHLPFVRHPEHERFLEEEWFYEAILECYLPLLDLFERMADRGVPFRLTVSLSPTLVAMLDDDLLRQRFGRHLERLRSLADREIHRTRLEPEVNRLARMYAARFARADRLWNRLQGDLAGAFGRLSDAGHLDLMTCAATHAFLPLLQNEPMSVAAQLRVATAEHHRRFGRAPAGVWLPECGTYPGLSRWLAENQLRFFITDAHGILLAKPRPRFGIFAPLLAPGGTAAFGRDPTSSRLVWSATEGFPGDPEYREFYRDIGFNLDLGYIRPFVQPTGERKNTGIKYHRISGRAEEKLLYRPERALARAREHARFFVAGRARQLSQAAELMPGRHPMVVAPFDAELFGHWWFEGPGFLEAVCEEIAASHELRCATPCDALDGGDSFQHASPASSSWGLGGYSQVWLDGSNDWIVNHLDHAGKEMVDLAARHAVATGLVRRALNQATRELMLAQASDWAFILKTGTVVDYAIRRIEEHLANFLGLAGQIRRGAVDLVTLQALEQRDNLFPDLDYRCYREDFEPGRARPD